MHRVIVVLGCAVAERASGGDEFVLNMARRWADAGVAIELVTTPEGVRRATDLGLLVTETRVIPSFFPRFSITVSYLLRSVCLVWTCLRLATKERGHPTAFLSATPFLPDIAGAVAARVLGAKWVLCWRLVVPVPWVRYEDANREVVRPKLPRFGQTLSSVSQALAVRLFKRLGSMLVVSNKEMRREAEQRGVRQELIRVGRLGIERSQLREGPELARESSPEVVFLGRFHAQKGLDDIPAIWERVHDRLPAVRLGIIGGGESGSEKRLKNDLRKWCDGSVAFCGVITGASKYRYLRQAKVFMFPSHYESWGHVVLEAMACGLAVVGYDIPSSREAFGDAIKYVPLGNQHQFAAEIISLLLDDELRASYSRTGLELAKRYDWESVAAELLADLNETLSRQQGK